MHKNNEDNVEYKELAVQLLNKKDYQMMTLPKNLIYFTIKATFTISSKCPAAVLKKPLSNPSNEQETYSFILRHTFWKSKQ